MAFAYTYAVLLDLACNTHTLRRCLAFELFIRRALVCYFLDPGSWSARSSALGATAWCLRDRVVVSWCLRGVGVVIEAVWVAVVDAGVHTIGTIVNSRKRRHAAWPWNSEWLHVAKLRRSQVERTVFMWWVRDGTIVWATAIVGWIWSCEVVWSWLSRVLVWVVLSVLIPGQASVSHH